MRSPVRAFRASASARVSSLGAAPLCGRLGGAARSGYGHRERCIREKARRARGRFAAEDVARCTSSPVGQDPGSSPGCRGYRACAPTSPPAQGGGDSWLRPARQPCGSSHDRAVAPGVGSSSTRAGTSRRRDSLSDCEVRLGWIPQTFVTEIPDDPGGKDTCTPPIEQNYPPASGTSLFSK
jgi:hypothetical protein